MTTPSHLWTLELERRCQEPILNTKRLWNKCHCCDMLKAPQLRCAALLCHTVLHSSQHSTLTAQGWNIL